MSCLFGMLVFIRYKKRKILIVHFVISFFFFFFFAKIITFFKTKTGLQKGGRSVTSLSNAQARRPKRRTSPVQLNKLPNGPKVGQGKGIYPLYTQEKEQESKVLISSFISARIVAML